MIHFSKERMMRVEEAHRLWWEHKLSRPLMSLTLTDAHSLPRPLKTPILSQANCHDFSVPAEDIIDSLDAFLSTQEYIGDGYPRVNFDAFGPGSLAAFLGARVDNHTGGVWFFPQEELPIEKLHLTYDPENPWAKRIKSIYHAGLERWDGLVKMGLPDLGGVMDVLASFRSTETLLTDLYDEPAEVLRLIGEIEKAWHDAYTDFSSVLAPQGGVTDWGGLWSVPSAYILQCDFCYMIGNPMFREFTLPTLSRDVQKLTNTIYHLDGKGQLNHLGDLLALPGLNAIQWVPGDGTPTGICWKEVYERISAAGKGAMLVGTPDDCLEVISTLHTNPYVHHHLSAGQTALTSALLEVR